MLMKKAIHVHQMIVNIAWKIEANGCNFIKYKIRFEFFLRYFLN